MAVSRLEALIGAVTPAYVGRNGSVTVWRPAPTLFVSRVVGHLDVDGARAIEAACRKQVAQDGRHVGFHDWSAMTDYDGAARVLLTDMTREILPRVEASHLFVTSRAVAFGVRAANVILRRLTVHTTRESFDAALAATLTRANVAPRP